MRIYNVFIIIALVFFINSCKKDKKTLTDEALKKNNIVFKKVYTIDPGPLGTSVLPSGKAKPPDNYNEEQATNRPTYDPQKSLDYTRLE